MSNTSVRRGLDEVIITGELNRRPSRPPDYEAENRALTALAEAMSTSPSGVLQRLVEAALKLTRCDSAGISLLEPGGEQGTFRWVATAGAWAPYCDGTMPREESPCGEVISRETILLMDRPERAFPALLQAQPGINEGLLAPFNIDDAPAGTLWAIKHDPEARFDAEDARLLTSLARFARVAHQMVLSLGGAEAGRLESDTRLRALARASSDVFYIMSADMSELRELSGGNFIADTTSPSRAWLRDYIPPEDHARTAAAISEAIHSKGVFELEHRVRQLDGGVGWALSRAVPILGASGEIVEWFGAASDITARKLAEATLRENEERQAFLLRLSDALRAEASAEAMTERALRMLFEQMRLDRCYVGIYRLAEDTGAFPHQVHNDRLPPLPAEVRLSDFPEALRVAFDRTLVIDDVVKMEGLSDSERASFAGLGMGALIAATLRKGENVPLWAICAVSANPRIWTQGDVALVEEVAERTWAAGERARAEAALRESEARLSQFGEASSDVLWMRDAGTFQWTYLTPAFETIYGLDRTAALSGDNMVGWADLIVPEDRERAVENLQRVRMGERVSFEYRIRRPTDGEIRWLRDTDFPMRDASGRVFSIGGVGRDITEEKDTAAHMSVLVDELQHRTRNLMGVVRATSDKTLRHSADLPDFKARFGTRLAALSRVQGLLSRLAEGERITFDELIRSEVAALDGEGTRIALHGPSGVALRSSTVQTFALAVHELATNAVKYGALAQSQAKLEIRWYVVNAEPDGGPWLHVDWRERDVRMPVNAGTPKSGSGRELIERALPYQLGARTSYVMETDGIHCTIALPVSGGTISGRRADA